MLNELSWAEVPPESWPPGEQFGRLVSDPSARDSPGCQVADLCGVESGFQPRLAAQ